MSIEIEVISKIIVWVLTAYCSLFGVCSYLAYNIYTTFKRSNDSDHDAIRKSHDKEISEIKKNLSETESKTEDNSKRLCYLLGIIEKKGGD